MSCTRSTGTWSILATLGLAFGSAAGAQDIQACGGSPGLPTWAQSSTYRGTLGGQPIALQLSRQSPDRDRYFYERSGIDLMLTPFHAGDTLILQEEVWQDAGDGLKVTGCLTLTRSGQRLSGTWNAPGHATRLPVQLTPLNVAQMPLQRPSSPGLLKLRAEDALTFLKLNRPWVMAAGGNSVREPLSGITYPQVFGASAGLQAALQDRVLQNAADALDCRGQLGDRFEGDDYNLRSNITLKTAHLISLREDVDYYCGGAHPDTFTTGLILDRATGQMVTLKALWPKLTPTRQKALYLAAVQPGLDADCQDVVQEMDADFTVNLTEKGVALTPTSLPHVVAACGETVTLPYGQLSAEVDRRSPYLRDLYPAQRP